MKSVQELPTKDAGPITEKAVPEKYADFKVPEGYQLDQKLVEEAKPIFKEMGLSQDYAQKLIDWYSRTQIANSKRAEETVTKMRGDWREATTRDPEIGPQMDKVKADVGKALTTIFKGDQKLISEFREAMDVTGAGDHPAVIRAFYRLASGVNEGTYVQGGGPSPHGQTQSGRQERPSLAQAIYPNLPH